MSGLPVGFLDSPHKRSASTRDAIWEYITNYIAVNGYSPSIREVGAGVGLKSSASVADHLNILEREGRITFIHNRSRTIRIVPQKEWPL